MSSLHERSQLLATLHSLLRGPPKKTLLLYCSPLPMNMSCATFVEPLSLTGAIVSGNTQGHFGNGKIHKSKNQDNSMPRCQGDGNILRHLSSFMETGPYGGRVHAVTLLRGERPKYLALTVFSSNFRRVSIQLFGCLSGEDQELPFQKHSMYKCPHHQHTWAREAKKIQRSDPIMCYW